MVEIFKLGDVIGPRATKWPKLDSNLTIKNSKLFYMYVALVL